METMNTERKKRYEARAVQGVAPGTPNRKVIKQEVVGGSVEYYHVTKGYKRIPNVMPDFKPQMKAIVRAQNYKRNKQ